MIVISIVGPETNGTGKFDLTRSGLPIQSNGRGERGLVSAHSDEGNRVPIRLTKAPIAVMNWDCMACLLVNPLRIKIE